MRHMKNFSRFFSAHVLLMLALLLTPSVSNAALNAYMTLTCGGTEIQGDPPGITNFGGVDVSTMIEVYAVGLNVSVARESTSGSLSGKRSYKPIRLLKRVDKSTPLIVQALAENQSCDAIIRLFDVDPDSGVTRHFFTITITQGRIAALMPVVPSTLDAATASAPISESLSIAFGTIGFESETGSTAYEDSWQTAK